MLPLLRCFFAHLLILQYPDHHQNLISSSLYYSGPVHKISSQSVHNFLSNVVHRQTDKQTNRQTNRQTNQRYQKHNLSLDNNKCDVLGMSRVLGRWRNSRLKIHMQTFPLWNWYSQRVYEDLASLAVCVAHLSGCYTNQNKNDLYTVMW